MSSFEKARQQAEILHLSGMKKGFEQIVEQLQSNIAKIDSRLEGLREQPADE
jgi:hypothetical protein